MLQMGNHLSKEQITTSICKIFHKSKNEYVVSLSCLKSFITINLLTMLHTGSSFLPLYLDTPHITVLMISYE